MTTWPPNSSRTGSSSIHSVAGQGCWLECPARECKVAIALSEADRALLSTNGWATGHRPGGVISRRFTVASLLECPGRAGARRWCVEDRAGGSLGCLAVFRVVAVLRAGDAGGALLAGAKGRGVPLVGARRAVAAPLDQPRRDDGVSRFAHLRKGVSAHRALLPGDAVGGGDFHHAAYHPRPGASDGHCPDFWSRGIEREDSSTKKHRRAARGRRSGGPRGSGAADSQSNCISLHRALAGDAAFRSHSSTGRGGCGGGEAIS